MDQPPDLQDPTLDPYPTFSIPRKPLHKEAASNTSLLEPRDRRAKGTNEAVTSDHRADHGSPFEVLKDWWLEILSCIITVAALIAIVAIIYPYQAQPLPQWPYSISINTLIAVMATIMKAAMLLITAEGLSQLKWSWFQKRQQRPLLDLAKYDMASRGPLGSIRLLFTLRHQHVIASIGAVITITALAIDPFAQQIVRYYSCPIDDTKFNATIARTNAFQGGIDSGAPEGAGTFPLTTGLQSAINGGLFNPGTFDIPFDCPSGNCTFGQYRTLGYCSKCEDVSKNLTISVSNVTTSQQLTQPNGSVINYPESSTLVNTSLPSGLSALYYNGSLIQNTTYFVMDALGPDDAPYEMILGASRLTLWDSAYPPPLECNVTAGKDTWYCNGKGAAACRIDPCVRTYTAAVHAGNLSETLIDYAFPAWGYTDVGQEGVTIDIDCLSSEQRQSLIKSGYQISPGTHWLAYNTSIFNETGQLNLSAYWSPDDGSTKKGDIPLECIYDINAFTTISISGWLSSYFQGSIIEGDDYGWGGPPVLQGLFSNADVDFPDINSTFSSIAEAMTTYIRRNGSSGFSAPALGVVQQAETCVQIRWWWLAYPAALVLFTILFFVAVVAEVGFAPGQGHDWKSSPLPLMFYGLEEDITDNQQRDLGGLLGVRDMERTAKSMRVRLGPSDNGWKFVKTD